MTEMARRMMKIRAERAFGPCPSFGRIVVGSTGAPGIFERFFIGYTAAA
jgi:hypothetical protein